MMIQPMTTSVRIACVGALLAALASTAPPALAQAAPPAKAKAGTPAPKSLMAPAGDRVLSPAQLKECIDQQTRGESDAAAAERERESIEGLKSGLKASGTALDESLATLDRTDPVAVDGYNARVKERDEQIAAYESRVTAYNGRVDGIRSTREAFAKTCGNRRYDTRDLDDLNRAKKK